MEAKVRDYDPQRDAAAVAALWERVFGRPAGGQTVEWLFRPGPAGEAPRTVAEINGRVVAHAGVMPLRFLVEGEQVRGGYSVAAMTDPAARGQRLFFRVGKHLYARLEREGFAFVAGFSNDNSHRLMTGPLRRTPIRPFPWCIRPLRPFAAVRRIARGSRANAAAEPNSPREPAQLAERSVEECGPDDSRLDALWQRAAEEVRVGAVRDASFAHWRFGNRDDAGYRVLIALGKRGPAAYAAYRTLRMRGLLAGFLADLLVAPSEPDAARRLLRAVASVGRAEGAHLMSALRPGCGPTRKALVRAGYFPVPELLHPQLIRFSVRGLGKWEGHPALADPSAWFLSWADTDVV